MKKNYKKGFTIIEILAVIVVLAILMVLVTPVITSSSNSAKKKTYETMISMIESSAVLYGQDNYRTLKENGSTTEEDEYVVEVEVPFLDLVPEYYKPENYDNISSSECKVKRPIDNTCIDRSTITIKLNTYSKKVTAEFNEVIN